jgi:hypothetical protein
MDALDPDRWNGFFGRFGLRAFLTLKHTVLPYSLIRTPNWSDAGSLGEE